MSGSERAALRVRPVATRAHRALSVLPWTASVVDLLVISATLICAATLRSTGMVFGGPTTVRDLELLAPVISLGWVVLIALRGGYESEAFGAGMDEYKRILAASALAAGSVGIGCYLAQYPLSRGFYVMTFAIGIPALLFSRLGLRKALQRTRRRGYLRQGVLIVGTSSAVDEIAKVLRRETWLGFEVMGALTPSAGTSEETPSGIPILGDSDLVAALAPGLGADLVFFAGGGISSAREMRRTMWSLEDDDIHVVVAPSMTDIASERVKIRPVGGLPLVHIGKPRAVHALRWAKRGFDVVGAAVLLVLAASVLLVAAVRIRAHDGGPVLFRQHRGGRNGEIFSCFKLRTMVVGAEKQLPDLQKQEGHEVGLFKMADDPRVTRPGRFLRRYSIDELPQLWNVLRGEMSLVGPRPPLPSEVARYDGAASRRLRVRPGMTGLWQVSGRSNLSWDETLRLDIYYVDNWSMLQDVSILMKTVGAVARSDGAY